MQKAQESGQWLIENSNESPDVVREVHEKLSSVSAPVELLHARLNERQIKLQSVLMQSEEFDVILGDFEKKLNEIATVAKKKKPISALYERVKDQNVQGENLMNDVKQQGIMFEKLMKSGQSVLGSLEDGLDKETLEKRLDEMKEQWQEVKGQAEEWNAKIAKVYPIAEDYKDKVDDFGTWLEGAEKGVEAMEPANVKKTEVSQEMAKIKVCNLNVTPMLKKLNKLSTIFRLHEVLRKIYNPLYSNYMKYFGKKLSAIFRLHEVLRKKIIRYIKLATHPLVHSLL